MMIRRWTPQQNLGTLKSQMDRLFDDFLGDWFAPGKESARAGSFTPPVDIKETKDAFEVTMEIPGISRKDLSVEMQDNVLSIRGERTFEKEEEGETFHRMERSYGTFCRSFSLSGPVEKEKIEASFKDGLLKLRLPKREEAKPRKIEIKG